MPGSPQSAVPRRVTLAAASEHAMPMGGCVTPIGRLKGSFVGGLFRPGSAIAPYLGRLYELGHAADLPRVDLHCVASIGQRAHARPCCTSGAGVRRLSYGGIRQNDQPSLRLMTSKISGWSLRSHSLPSALWASSTFHTQSSNSMSLQRSKPRARSAALMRGSSSGVGSRPAKDAGAEGEAGKGNCRRHSDRTDRSHGMLPCQW